MVALCSSVGMRRLNSVLRGPVHSGTLPNLQAIPNNDAYLNRRFPSRPTYSSCMWTYSLVRFVAVSFNKTSHGGVLGCAAEGFLWVTIGLQCMGKAGGGGVGPWKATAAWSVRLRESENIWRIITVSTATTVRIAVRRTFFSILHFVSPPPISIEHHQNEITEQTDDF